MSCAEIAKALPGQARARPAGGFSWTCSMPGSALPEDFRELQSRPAHWGLKKAHKMPELRARMLCCSEQAGVGFEALAKFRHSFPFIPKTEGTSMNIKDPQGHQGSVPQPSMTVAQPSDAYSLSKLVSLV